MQKIDNLIINLKFLDGICLLSLLTFKYGYAVSQAIPLHKNRMYSTSPHSPLLRRSVASVLVAERYWRRSLHPWLQMISYFVLSFNSPQFPYTKNWLRLFLFYVIWINIAIRMSKNIEPTTSFCFKATFNVNVHVLTTSKNKI